MLDILTSHTFLVVLMGSIFLAIASGIMGTISIQKGQSLIGDALGHSAFPGIVIAFILFQTRSPFVLLMGAMVSCAVAYLLIQAVAKHSKIQLDSALAIFLSGLFGLGMVLKSYIQGNPDFSGASQAGLQNYIFGQAAYMMQEEVWIVFGVMVLIIAILLLFYKEIKVFIFDPEFAKIIGLSTGKMELIMLVLMISLISVGLKLVGFILIASFLILPAIAAQQWSSRFGHVILLACLVGVLGATIGAYLSSIYAGMSTGPTMILVMGSIALISMVIGPLGPVRTYLRRKRA